MSKRGKSLIAAMEEAISNPEALVTLIPSPDVSSLRKRLNLSQRQFAQTYRINLTTLQKWEQGKRQPDSISAAYLSCINKAPDVIQSLVAQ